MSPILIAGTIIVNLALISYAIGIIGEQRSHRVSSRVLAFLVVGVVLDITATACMISGSTRGWRHRRRHGNDVVPLWLHHWSRIAFGWWVVAYFTGAYLVMSTRLAA